MKWHEPNQRLRIGYVSADFKTHPVGKIFRSIFTCHNREEFDFYCYSDTDGKDALTEEVKACSKRFETIRGRPDDEVYDLVRSDKIDVLVDLGGFTGGGNRLSLFARRTAPKQVSFLGYPATSGLVEMDYRITDALADPIGTADELYAEKLLRLESGFLAWTPYDVCKKIVPKNEGAPKIGAFNNVAKLSDACLRSIACILVRNPHATLVMKYGDRYEVRIVRDRLRRIFAEHGVLPSQIMFLPVGPTLVDHLNVLASVDVALDSFPYQGTMTTLETLSVGTPIVSLCGEYYAHRATSAMLMRLGLEELVAESENEYCELASQLIGDLDSLRELRAEVAERFYGSPLVSPASFAAELERTYTKIASQV